MSASTGQLPPLGKGNFVEGEGFAGLRRAGHVRRAMDFACSDFYVPASIQEGKPQLDVLSDLDTTSGDLATYTNDYNSNIQCFLLDMKSRDPRDISLKDGNYTHLFVFAWPDKPDVVYVVPHEKIECLGGTHSHGQGFESVGSRLRGDPYYEQLLPYSWTKDEWPDLLRQISRGQLLRNKRTGITTNWSRKPIAFQEGVHQFQHYCHRLAADALMRFAHITTPILDVMQDPIRINFTRYQPLGGDFVAIIGSGSAQKEAFLQHKASSNEGIIPAAFRPHEKWDFLIHEKSPSGPIRVYSRASQRLPSSPEVKDHKWHPELESCGSHAIECEGPFEDHTAGQLIIAYIKREWNSAKEASSQAVGYKSDANSTAGVAVDDVETQETPAPDAIDNVSKRNIQQKSIICEKYNKSARETRQKTRMLILSKIVNMGHPLADAIVVILDEGKLDWSDERLRQWLFNPRELMMNNPGCIFVTFYPRNLGSYDDLTCQLFPPQSSTTRIPITQTRMFCLGYPSFLRMIPYRLLLYPSEHLNYPATVSQYQRVDSDEQIASSFFLKMWQFNAEARHQLLAPKKPQSRFWQDLPAIQYAFEDIFSSTTGRQNFLNIKREEYIHSWHSVLQAIVTHGHCPVVDKGGIGKNSLGLDAPRVLKGRLRAGDDYQSALQAQHNTASETSEHGEGI